jgi:carboxyl-terminal processing protease
MRFLLLFFLCVQSVWAAPKQLGRPDVRLTLEEMLAYHVEFKEVNPTIIRRSFKLFVEQADPEKVYLLKEEVAPFLELTRAHVDQIIEEYRSDAFSAYASLNAVIQHAIARSRAWRQEIERELILKGEGKESILGESYLGYAPSERQLKERIRKRLLRFLLAEKDAKTAWTPERRRKIFALWERRMQRLEQTYLPQEQPEQTEHCLTVHILKAMAKGLDAHTSYYTPEEAHEMRSSLEKQFEGVGVILREGVDGVFIHDVIRGGPAARSGHIAAGDLLVAVDGRSMQGASYDEVLASMQGGRGQEIVLDLKRVEADGREHLIQVELRRERVVLEEERLRYSYAPFGNGIIGKLTLPSFYESEDAPSCETDIREALRDLKKRGEIKGLILDLRDNSGGFLNQAVKVAGLFVSSGVIVISKYAHGEVQYLRNVDGRLYYDGPLVVLTSKASASAAEIVAGALQDYGIALVAGDERTYGKGSIQYQTVTEEDAPAYFKVTVGRYYTVSGRSTQIEGVPADLLVPTVYSALNIGERYLEYPLPNDRVASAYADPLSDLSGKTKLWFQSNYLPRLQQKNPYWRRMLPLLKDNSAYRLAHNPNFQAFLASLRDTAEAQSDWGAEDLQMAEALDILRDMILMRAENAPPPAHK